MFSGGKRSRVLLATISVLPLCLAYACGGRASSSNDFGEGGRIEPDAGKGASSGDGGGGVGGTSGGPAVDAGPDAAPDADLDGGVVDSGGPDGYVDPGCPDAAPPDDYYECDPFNEPSGCGVGEGCYPYVDHPFGEGCDVQTFGALCLPAGSGGQGEECGLGTDGCSPGYVCVVGAQAGKRCVQMCDLDGPDECPPGLICGETDVEGVGVCS